LDQLVLAGVEHGRPRRRVVPQPSPPGAKL